MTTFVRLKEVTFTFGIRHFSQRLLGLSKGTGKKWQLADWSVPNNHPRNSFLFVSKMMNTVETR